MAKLAHKHGEGGTSRNGNNGNRVQVCHVQKTSYALLASKALCNFVVCQIIKYAFCKQGICFLVPSRISFEYLVCTSVMAPYTPAGAKRIPDLTVP